MVMGKKYLFWEASWSPRPNEVKKKVFSIDKYGEKRAKQMALQTRRKGLATMTRA
jgi:hypothetical protein